MDAADATVLGSQMRPRDWWPRVAAAMIQSPMSFRPGHLMLLALLACGIALARAPRGGEGRADIPSDVAERIARPFPRKLGEVTVSAPPQRIVAASVFSAETLLEIAPASRMAGVHFLAADARYSRVADKAKATQLLGASPEQLIAARPDLVVIDEFTLADTAILLRSFGIPVVRTRPVASFDDVAANIRLLGFATGADKEAEALCERMFARREAIREAGKSLGAWRVMNCNGALDTYGARSLLDDAVRIAGASHLPADHGVGGYCKLDVETVLGWRPDALLVSVGDNDDAAWVGQHPGLRLLPCVQRGRVARIPASLLSSTSHHAIEVAALLQQTLVAWEKP